MRWGGEGKVDKYKIYSGGNNIVNVTHFSKPNVAMR